jgi:hypothetical protein
MSYDSSKMMGFSFDIQAVVESNGPGTRAPRADPAVPVDWNSGPHTRAEEYTTGSSD